MLAMSDSTAGTTAFSEWNQDTPPFPEKVYTCFACRETAPIEKHVLPLGWSVLQWRESENADKFTYFCRDCTHSVLEDW